MPKFSRNEINIAKIMLTINKKQIQKLKKPSQGLIRNSPNHSRLIIKLKKTK